MERTLNLRVDNEQMRVLMTALKYYKKTMYQLMNKEGNSNLTKEIFRQEKQIAIDLSKQIQIKDDLRKRKLPSLPPNIKQVMDEEKSKNFLLEEIYDLKDKNGAVIAFGGKSGSSLLEVTYKENQFVIKKNQETIAEVLDEEKALEEFVELLDK